MEKDDLGDGGGGTDRSAHSTYNHLMCRLRTCRHYGNAVDIKKRLKAGNIQSFCFYLVRI